MNNDDKEFLSRWSQRKAEARKDGKEREENDAAAPGETEPAPEGEMLAESDFDDVDFDALDNSSDYTRFAKANVPGAIQKLALRKLWDSDPVFEVLDGMNDYDEDFTGTGLAGKALKTAYKVGKGYLLDEDEPPEETAKSKDTPAQTPAATAPQSTPVAESENTEPGQHESDTG